MQPMTPSLNTSVDSATKSLVVTAPCKSTFAHTQVGEVHAEVHKLRAGGMENISHQGWLNFAQPM